MKNKMFLYRVPTEIKKFLDKMEAPSTKFNSGDIQVDMLLDDTFKSGYNQAVKEIKKFFGGFNG